MPLRDDEARGESLADALRSMLRGRRPREGSLGIEAGGTGPRLPSGPRGGALARHPVAWTWAALGGALLLVVGLTLPGYGWVYDEVLGDHLKGERILAFWTGGLDLTALDTETRHPSDGDGVSHPDFWAMGRRGAIWQFFAVGGLVSAVTCRLLTPALAPVDAHHLGIVLVALAGLWFLFADTWRRWSPGAAALAVGVIALHPRVFAHLHDNAKDVASMAAITATLVVARRAVATGSTRAIVAAAALWGVALASKLNAVFVPVLLLPWAVHHVWRRTRGGAPAPEEAVRPWGAARALAWLAAAPVIALASAAVLDPFHLAHPDHLGRFLEYYRDLAARGEPAWSALPLLKFVGTVPPVYLVAFMAGLATLAARRDVPSLLFYGWWFAFPILRVSVPGAHDFNGIRHWMECVPPFAVVAAVGAMALAARAAAGRPAAVQRQVGGLLALLVLGPAAAGVIAYHPHQIVYYNGLVGGFSGAPEHGLREVDYWCSSYREGLGWIAREHPEGGVVDARFAAHLLPAYLPAELGELAVAGTPEGEAAMSAGTRLFLLDTRRPKFPNARPKPYDDLAEDAGPPLHSIERDGRPLLEVRRIDLPPLGGRLVLDAARTRDPRLHLSHQAGEARDGAWVTGGDAEGRLLVHGPGLHGLPPGRWRATFELELPDDAIAGEDAPVARLDVVDASARSTLAERAVVAGDFRTGGDGRTASVTLEFDVAGRTALETRVLNSGTVPYGCRRIVLEPAGAGPD